MEAFFKQAVAVGPPYFNLIFGPILLLAMAFLPISLFLAWKKGNLTYGISQVIIALGIALVLGFGLASFYAPGTLGFQPSLALGLAMGAYVILGSLKWLWERIKGEDWLHRLIHIEPSAKAMVLAHIGLGLLVIGAVSDHHGRQIATKPMMVGDSLTLGPATLSFKALDRIEASNFDAQRAQFVITKAGNQICQTQAQRRFFQHSSEIIGKVGLCFMPFSDYYVIMGDPIILSDEQPRFQVRFLYNPMIRLIFLGIFFMVSAGLIAGLGARLRPKPTP
jgi:cytochrome c-type biogenesis protein CcmF